jgi:hypothetical protein
VLQMQDQRLFECRKQLLGKHRRVTVELQPGDDFLLARYVLRCQCNMFVSQG